MSCRTSELSDKWVVGQVGHQTIELFDKLIVGQVHFLQFCMTSELLDK